MRTRLISALTASVAALAVMVPAATPAAASTRYSFDVQTPFNTGTAAIGSAHAWGSIEFFNPTAFNFQISVKDACPADGYGAYVQIVYFSNTGTVGYSGWNWYQNNGCSQTAVSPTALITTGSFQINYLEIEVCERDNSGGTWRMGDCAWSNAKDNPYA